MWKNLGLTGNLTLTFTTTGCNALSIKQIKPTGEQAIVMSDFFTFFFNHLGCLFNYKDHFHFHKNNTFKCHHVIKKIAI